MPRLRVGQGSSVGTPVTPQDRRPEGLTCIPLRIHCPATPDAPEDVDELDRIDIDNFLSTLAEVAFAVARREQQPGDHEGRGLRTGQ